MVVLAWPWAPGRRLLGAHSSPHGFALAFPGLQHSLQEVMGLTPGGQKLWLLFPASSQPYHEAHHALAFLSANGESLHLA